MHSEKTGVLIMSYGSATTSGGVAEYFERIYRGKASKELVQDFENRYRLVGHSPLIEITGQQATMLQQILGDAFIVRSGMRHSSPYIEDMVRECYEQGARQLLGIILAPQFSSFIMEGYHTTFRAAAHEAGFIDERIVLANPWPMEKAFIELLTKRVREQLQELQEQHETGVPIVFTTHSLPRRIIEQDPSYLQQLQATSDAVLTHLNQPELEWYAAYQSAGHTPEEWLKPDLTDVLMELRTKHKRAVLIVPIQFLSDHLEILYDLDIAAKQQCDDYAIAYHRIELPNTDPLFIRGLANIVNYTLQTKMHDTAKKS